MDATNKGAGNMNNTNKNTKPMGIAQAADMIRRALPTATPQVVGKLAAQILAAQEAKAKGYIDPT
jgi:hypothetical protein